MYTQGYETKPIYLTIKPVYVPVRVQNVSSNTIELFEVHNSYTLDQNLMNSYYNAQ